MAKRVLIFTANRFIINMTSNDSAVAPQGHTYIPVSDSYNLESSQRKMDVDNVTQLVPTTQEIEESKDLFNPYRVVVRILRQKSLALHVSAGVVKDDATLPNNVRQMASDMRRFLVAFRDMVKEIT